MSHAFIIVPRYHDRAINKRKGFNCAIRDDIPAG